MNKRIRELEAQCWEHDQSWTGVGQRVFNKEKFSELIVQDCLGVLKRRFMGDLNREDMEVKRCIEDVEDHFWS
jgi:hypothetical protein